MLGLGLVAVDPDVEVGGVEVLLDPGEYKPRRSKQRRERLLGEFVRRVGDPHPGGTETRKGIMTAYRQRALRICLFLQENGPTKASEVAQALGEPKARSILYRDVYGWFERPSVGVYELSPRGEREIPLWRDAAGEGIWQALEAREETDEEGAGQEGASERQTAAAMG